MDLYFGTFVCPELPQFTSMASQADIHAAVQDMLGAASSQCCPKFPGQQQHSHHHAYHCPCLYRIVTRPPQMCNSATWLPGFRRHDGAGRSPNPHLLPTIPVQCQSGPATPHFALFAPADSCSRLSWLDRNSCRFFPDVVQKPHRIITPCGVHFGKQEVHFGMGEQKVSTDVCPLHMWFSSWYSPKSPLGALRK